MKWILIRHGQAQGNQEHRYIGCRTDKSLCPEGIAALQGKAVPPAVKVFVSLMKRCLETTALIYPGVPVEIVDDLRECAIVARGGTIMAIMEQFALPKGTYFDYQVHNGCGFILEDDGSYQTI